MVCLAWNVRRLIYPRKVKKMQLCIKGVENVNNKLVFVQNVNECCKCFETSLVCLGLTLMDIN